MTTPPPCPPLKHPPQPIGYAVVTGIEDASDNSTTGSLTGGAELAVTVLILNPDNTVRQTVNLNVNFHYGDTPEQIRTAIQTAFKAMFPVYGLQMADRASNF